MAESLYPLRLIPIYKRFLWGGRRFETILGRDLGPGEDYAESWEVADHPAGQSVVECGPLKGVSLHELVSTRGEELLGRHHPRPRFPLLLKYLDARLRLSVQVHPDDAMAQQMSLGDPGKTEAWVVVHAEPGSKLYAGLSRPLDREALLRALEDGRLEEHLHSVEPRPGDCYLLRAGTIHALGEGLLVAEIQTPSDVTFRLHDWGRVGPDGRPRPLHIHQAAQSMRVPQGPVLPQIPQPLGSGRERLVACEQFVLDRISLHAGTVGGDQRCHVLTVLEGEVTVTGDPAGGPLRRGSSMVVPAGCGAVAISSQSSEPAVLLDAFLP